MTPQKKDLTKERLTKRNSSVSRCSPEQRSDFSFSSSSGNFEGITDIDRADWISAYTSIDISKEIIKAEQWLKANPTKAKKKLWRKFLVGWFTRANDKAENQAAYRSNNPSSAKDSKFRSWEKDKPKETWKPKKPTMADFQ